MAEQEEALQVLMRTPLFRGLRRRQLDRLARRFVERSYKEGDAIVTQGKGGEGFFIIASGEAEAVHRRGDGSTVVLNPLLPGDFFGELALLTDTMRTASVIAKQPTRCMVLTRWDFLGVLKEDAEMAVSVLQELAERFSRLLSTL
ncbi:MAG: cyclic nucleotide-binding domain-containing protein [Anaerolineae bacterium]